MSKQVNVTQAEQFGLFPLYEFSPSEEMLDTQYGRIGYQEWLEKEKKRIECNPLRRAAIVRLSNNKNMLALFVNAPAVWESEARDLGYYPIIDGWSTPDDKLLKLGFIEPRLIIREKYERAAADDKHVVIVRKDGGNDFAVFRRVMFNTTIPS